MPRATVRRLADALSGPGVAVVCALTGLRGVGKTQVAAAYARSSVDAGDGLVGWVDAEVRDDLLAGLARIAARVGVADPDGDSLKSARSGCASTWKPEQALRWWCSTMLSTLTHCCNSCRQPAPLGS